MLVETVKNHNSQVEIITPNASVWEDGFPKLYYCVSESSSLKAQ